MDDQWYTAALEGVRRAYLETPAWSGTRYQNFEDALRNAWFKHLPDMEKPLRCVEDLRRDIIHGFAALKDALKTDEDQAAATKTLVSAEYCPETV